MDAEADTERTQTVDEEDADDHVVTACETCPGKTVFTERDNSDAWIATDLAVTPER
ncbi:hypothetical protein ACFQDG_10430 [Natronoarchaeum mannanilyticum]|uniref:Uncharacterized protein n=1 Tax=Natronoarchaeum mannanilyticum TaxID=926360 RepID=A0AAV3TBY8_9EURY